MKLYIDGMKDYWNKRFLDDGKIWGVKPSKTAYYALKLFKNFNVRTVVVPGCGYGRNTKLFSNAGFKVVGVEISDIAVKDARKFDTKTKFYRKSVLKIDILGKKFDAVYCFNLLHLFREKERLQFIEKCNKILNDDGFTFLSVFSDREESFGRGKKIEENTFESKPGRIAHYFTREDLLLHFNNFDVIEIGEMSDEENHGEEGKHVHNLRYIFCSKRVF
ncbi:MAG: class I SAM-dependent methyltransferase [candidate division WOR-3 bacterium]